VSETHRVSVWSKEIKLRRGWMQGRVAGVSASFYRVRTVGGGWTVRKLQGEETMRHRRFGRGREGAGLGHAKGLVTMGKASQRRHSVRWWPANGGWRQLHEVGDDARLGHVGLRWAEKVGRG
jgi:hypothetical protein